MFRRSPTQKPKKMPSSTQLVSFFNKKTIRITTFELPDLNWTISYTPIFSGCRKAFGVESKRKRHTHSIRHRRDHHSLEELFKTYLSWLTEDQQKKLTELKAEGKSREDLQKQVLEYYEAASDSVKENAREKMQDGCRKL